MAKSKKVMLFIVEGASDENTLGSQLKRVFKSNEVHFHVIRGDITTDNRISESNVIKEISLLVKSTMNKYGFQHRDMLKIIHLFDTDGAFIQESDVIDDSTHRLSYELDRILTNQVGNIVKRNVKKARILNKLSTLSNLSKIPYTGYYFSRNLEHTLHGNMEDLDDNKKRELAYTFADIYENKSCEEFIQFFSNESFAVTGTHPETWEFIKQGTNSLHRLSNFHLLFEEIE